MMKLIDERKKNEWHGTYICEAIFIFGKENPVPKNLSYFNHKQKKVSDADVYGSIKTKPAIIFLMLFFMSINFHEAENCLFC